MKRFISFDVDGTLVRPEFNDLIWRKALPELYARKHRMEIEEARKFVEREYDKIGQYDLRWYSLDFWLGYFELNAKEKEILGKYAEEVSLYPDVLPTLEKLSKRYQLVIASCMGGDFIEVKLQKRGMGKYFTHIFSAISLGLIKKEEKFYFDLCSRLAINPEELVHIGDHYEFDYLVPRRVGIEAYYLDRNEDSQKASSGVVKSLGELGRHLLKEEKNIS